MRRTTGSATTAHFAANAAWLAPARRRLAVLFVALLTLLVVARADAAPVQLTDLDGAVVGGFSYPKGIALVPGPDGSAASLWVSDADDYKLHRISPDGLLSDLTVGSGLTGAGTLLHPSGIDFDPASQTLYVADSLRNRVLALDADGVVTGQQPSPPLADCPMGCSGSSADGRFRAPSDVAFDDGNLFVVDSGNNRLQKFSTGPLSWLSTTGFPAGANPEGVEIDAASGDVFVTSADGVTVIAPGGSQRTFGADLELPYGLALDASRNLLYVADYLAGAVVVFDPVTGLEVDRIAGVEKPVGLALDPVTQILYVSRPEASVIARYDVTPPPTCDAPEDIKAVAGQPVSAAVDCETLAGAITYEIVGQPLHGTVSDFDAATGSFVYTPNTGYSGADLVQVQATGAGGPGPVVDVVFDVTVPPAPIVAAAAAVPVVHETANLHRVTGTVLVRLPGENNFKLLTSDILVPLGTLVDATKGRATLTFADAAKKFYDGTFWAGAFQIGQTDGDSPFHEIKLRSEFAPGGVCRKAKKKRKKKAKKAGIAVASDHAVAISAKKRKKGKKKGKVWGDGNGSFRTSGSSGSASVRGTRWAVTDYEFGTLFQVSRGEVSVRDNAAHKTVILKAGDSYFAWLSPKSKNAKTNCKI